jgi:hypothetical protein
MMQNTPINGMMQKFQQFKQTFRGDPQQTVQQMLNSGKITQDQYNKAVQTANQFMRIFGGK